MPSNIDATIMDRGFGVPVVTDSGHKLVCDSNLATTSFQAG